ncbi:uncharacterized protein LOC143045442 isoform X3 [Mytilus galloprovincialis]|uniref:uncharacterized protein LOC143045442 isoform X3 n=1 Tax=Mytilus galloprovincialis TaxID=29158 RepID=UPI003F7B41AF
MIFIPTIDQHQCYIMDDQLRTPSPGWGSGSRTPSPASRTPSPSARHRTPSPPFRGHKTHSVIRPHSSKPKKQINSTEDEVPVRHMPNLRRPWTAHVKSSQSQKIARKTSKKISRKTPTRTEITFETNGPTPRKEKSPRSSPKSFSGEQFMLRTPMSKHNEESDRAETNHTTLDGGVKTLMSEENEGESWAITNAYENGIDGRQKKKHPTYESWLAGSPHDSDEYDTDLEADVQKVDEKKELDPTGKTAYNEACEKTGLIPVTYMNKHLGDKNLRMRHHYLGGNGTKPIARALEINTITENLDLADNYLESEGARYVARMLKDNMFIVSLDISNNFIQRAGVAAIGDMLEYNTTLKTLAIAGNQLTDVDAWHLVEPLKTNTSLTSLDLSNNNFGELGGIYLGGALALNEGLLDLDLSWNSLRNKGAETIANALIKNETLEVLDVSWNGFGERGMKEMQNSLKINKKLRVLDLSNNRINKKAASLLSIGIKQNTGLESLILNLNPMGDEGMESIINMVKLQPTLNYVSLEEMNLSPANYHRILDLQSERDISILHGGSGGYQRYTSQTSVMRLFTKFLREHRPDIETAFLQQDKDHSGNLSSEDLKMALKTAGLRLTNKQLGILLEDIDMNHSGEIKYKDILSGTALVGKRKSSQVYTLAGLESKIHVLSNRGKEIGVS